MKKRGFTLIELLVVIAIIGILAGIVLVSLTGTRKRAKDSRIISDMNQIRTTAEVIYSLDRNYSRVACATSSEGIDKLCEDINDQGGTSFNIYKPSASPVDRYCAKVQLNSGKWYCVDSDLRSKDSTNDPTTCSNNSYTCE